MEGNQVAVGDGGGGGEPPRRNSMAVSGDTGRKKGKATGGSGDRRASLSRNASTAGGERTVKSLRLSKALTIPENTTVQEACRRMAIRRVDAVLLTDSNALLCGILTDKDIARRVVAHELNLEETPVSKVMTRHPFFVISDTLAVEALQKMVQGKFRHLPVVENGEVIALLDIAKCLYDAIARMERAAKKGEAIAAAVEGVEKNWGQTVSGPNTFIETLRERMLRPSLSTMIPENPKLVSVLPTDSVLSATKEMLKCQVSSAVVVDTELRGILTPRDILMRVIAGNLPPDSTPVEKVMTPSPECGKLDTPIVDALHIMHDGKFLHLPVLDGEGKVVSVLDAIDITHAAITTAGSIGSAGNEISMIQSIWGSAFQAGLLDDNSDTHSEGSMKIGSDFTEIGRAAIYPPSELSSIFGFKLQDRQGRMHRFNCETHSLSDLIASILQRVGDDIDRNRHPQILYEDEDHDKVILESDDDLAAAVEHARQAGWKSLRLHLDYSGLGKRKNARGGSRSLAHEQKDAWTTAYGTVAAGAALVAGLGVMAYLKRSGY